MMKPLQNLVLALGFMIALAVAVIFIGSFFYTDAICANHGGRHGADGDAWMLTFFLALPGIPAIIVVVISAIAWAREPQGRRF